MYMDFYDYSTGTTYLFNLYNKFMKKNNINLVKM
jgi:hypothetical protein